MNCHQAPGLFVYARTHQVYSVEGVNPIDGKIKECVSGLLTTPTASVATRANGRACVCQPSECGERYVILETEIVSTVSKQSARGNMSWQASLRYGADG